MQVIWVDVPQSFVVSFWFLGATSSRHEVEIFEGTSLDALHFSGVKQAFLGGNFTPSWGNDPICLIFFEWVKTTN